MNINKERLDELVRMGILKPVEQQMEKEDQEEIYNLYNEYLSSRDKNTLIKLIDLINNSVNSQNIREFLDLKIDNETLFDIMVKLKTEFSFLLIEYICSQEDLLVKVIKNDGHKILNYANGEDFFKQINGITIFEYLIKNNLFCDYWLIKIKQNNNVIEILKKYHKDEYLRHASENIMFEKYNEEKLVVEYLLEQDLLTPHNMDRIREHPEIIEYIEKYNKNYLLDYLQDDILLAKKDNKLILESLLGKGITPVLSTIPNNEIVNLYMKYNAYEPLSEIGINQAFMEVPGTNMQLFEFLLLRGVVSYKVISEIYRNTEYAPTIYEILEKHHNLNLISHFDEDRLLLKYGQEITLLESLLKDRQLINNRLYEQKESFDLLIAYDRYDELAKCSQELLLKELPNGKKLYEELMSRGIEIQTGDITSQEIAKKIIDKKYVEQLECLSTEVLLSYANLNETYLDKVLDIATKEPYLKVIDYLTLPSSSLKEKAKIYIIFGRHNFQERTNELSVEDLLQEENGVTLLEELLQEDKKIAVNKILTQAVKSNPEIASILRLHGIKPQNIQYDIVTKNIADEYTSKDYEEMSKVPLTPDQERLLQELFIVMNDGNSELDKINALVTTYRFLLSTNNQFANEIYHLINLKKQNPDFRIEGTKGTSHYNSDSQVIRLENLNMSTLNHEISHSLHFMIDNSSIPNGFEDLLKRHQKSFKMHVMVSIFSMKYNEVRKKITNRVDKILMKEYTENIKREDIEKIKEYLETLNTKQKEEYQQRGYAKQLLDYLLDQSFTVGDYLTQTKKIQKNQMIDRILRTEYPHLVAIADFFDGIYEGKCFEGKLYDVFNLIKLPSIGGHGVAYYKGDTHAIFKEMVANYGTIMKSKNPSEGLEMMRYYLGDEFVSFIAQYYIQEIYHNYSYLDTQTKTL